MYDARELYGFHVDAYKTSRTSVALEAMDAVEMHEAFEAEGIQ